MSWTKMTCSLQSKQNPKQVQWFFSIKIAVSLQLAIPV